MLLLLAATRLCVWIRQLARRWYVEAPSQQSPGAVLPSCRKGCGDWLLVLLLLQSFCLSLSKLPVVWRLLEIPRIKWRRCLLPERHGMKRGDESSQWQAEDAETSCQQTEHSCFNVKTLSPAYAAGFRPQSPESRKLCAETTLQALCKHRGACNAWPSFTFGNAGSVVAIGNALCKTAQSHRDPPP